jgi:protein SCO1/2
VTSGDFLGRWVLLYFGFTNCPEICPEQLQKMVTVVDTVNAAYTTRKTVTPVFVSIDPLRDSCEEVHRFIRQFSSKIVGLCGTPAQVQAAARQWRVFYSVPDGHTAARDYLIDHSVVAYLVQPDGRLAGVYPAEFDTAEMAASIRRRITQFDRRPVFEGLFSSLDDGALDFPFGFFASQNARMERERARRIAEYAFIDAEEA